METPSSFRGNRLVGLRMASCGGLFAPQKYTKRPLTPAVISASALSRLYPAASLLDDPKEKFLEDLAKEAKRDIRECLDAGAANVQD